MSRLRVTNKVGLGRLVLSAASDKFLRESLIKDPQRYLQRLVEELPEGYKIIVIHEDENSAVLVIPAQEDVPSGTEAKEAILRQEGSDYDDAKRHVEDKKEDSGEIPKDVVEETYALMVGHTALSPSSRPRRKWVP
jgi:hypothetical protein